MSKISLVVIARNEERCIARCLQSAAPFVDQMLVLDTGSTDRTREIARAQGAQVYTFTWVDDFAQARNRSLELADSDWNLVLDADEWIESGGAALRDFITQHSHAIGVVSQRSTYLSDGRLLQGNTLVSRLLPRGVRYAGRVHEQPVSTLPRIATPLVLGHDGYESAQMERKKDRNLALLQVEAAQDPDNAYVNYQLGKELELRKDYAQACAYYERAWTHLPDSAGFAHPLAIGWLYCLGKSGRFAEALERGSAWMGQWQDSPDFFFVLGNLLLDKAIEAPEGDPLHWLDMARSAWERCLEIGEQPQMSGAVLGRGSYLAAFNLALALEQLGQSEQAQALRSAYPMPA